jgi:hypothetical protein
VDGANAPPHFAFVSPINSTAVLSILIHNPI